MRVASGCKNGVWSPSFAEKLSQGVTWQEIREQLEQHKQERFEAKAREKFMAKAREKARERARDAAEREALKSVPIGRRLLEKSPREYFRRITENARYDQHINSIRGR